MKNSKLRLLGMSALVGAGLMATGPAGAQVRLGTFDVRVDTSAVVGVSMRVADREMELVAPSNGSTRKDTQARISGVTPVGLGPDTATAAQACELNGGNCFVMPAEEAVGERNGAYTSSINADDSRLNFDSGDLTGGSLKITSDITASSGDLTLFARVNGYYDGVLDSSGSYERTDIGSDGRKRAVGNVSVLDLYANYDFDLAGNPANLRVGKQVINWGESTFVTGGNSVFNPLDVSALLKPGAEIKEGLLPVNAIYASTALPYDISVEAYVGDHKPYVLPSANTPFGFSDGFFGGGAHGVNGSFIGGGEGAGAGRINCQTSAADATAAGYGSAAASAQAIALARIAEDFSRARYGVDCDTNDGDNFLNMRYKLGSGTATPEEERLAGGDSYFLVRDNSLDTESEFGDSSGLAVRWYSEMLGSTEFGLYYQKYQSRVPYVGVYTVGPTFGLSGVQDYTSGLNRWGNAPGLTGMADACAASTATVLAAYGSLSINDPGSMLNEDSEAGQDLMAAIGNPSLTSDENTLGRAFELACASINNANSSGNGIDNGEMFAGIGFGNSLLYAEYPEIEALGFSFATTVFGWGVQGEVVSRPEMPLQVDTDSVTIASLVSNCAFLMYGGGVTTAIFEGLSEYKKAGLAKCGTYGKHSGYVEDTDVTNWDIGTTATFTRSNPVVGFLGANRAVLLTEFAGVIADGIDDATGRHEDGDGIVTTNMCTSGSDLGLKGVFSLDPRDTDECRATESAYGAVLLANLQYTNVMGTAMTVTPQFVYQVGLEGRAVRPAASWVEDQGRMGVSVGIDYQDLSFGISYTDFFGDIEYNSSIDRDFVAINLKTSF